MPSSSLRVRLGDEAGDDLVAAARVGLVLVEGLVDREARPDSARRDALTFRS